MTHSMSPFHDDPMPPISGGTLMVTRDGQYAVAADSEADRVFVVDIAARKLTRSIMLPTGAEPGRVAEGIDGRVHVVMRNAAKLATISLQTGDVVMRDACVEPRGLGYDEVSQRVHMACVGGELLSFTDDPTLSTPVRSLQLDGDLRDVVVHEDELYVTRFRSAEVLVLDADGVETKRFYPGSYQLTEGNFQAGVAWRARPTSGGLLAVVHQAALTDTLPTDGPIAGVQPYYGGGAEACVPAVVTAATTVYDMRTGVKMTLEGQGNLASPVLPVDIAVSAEFEVAVAAAGSDMVVIKQLYETIADNGMPCGGSGPGVVAVDNPVAVAFDLAGQLLVQSRTQGLMFIEPGTGVVARLPFPKPFIANTGHNIFHKRANPVGSQIACASCHPEGHDDGHAWNFQKLGLRRTQSLLGGVMETTPLHWDGDMHSLDALVEEVFVSRMAGPLLTNNEMEVLGDWMHGLRALRPSKPADEQAVERGRQVFNSQEVGCNNCHNGPRLTDGRTLDVGTGKAFQVPSLVGVGFRTPLMHDGCAETVEDRFGSCGGGDEHGRTSQLSSLQLSDLVMYLNSL